MRIPKEFKERHIPEYRRRRAGSRSWGRGGAVYNYSAFCSCGWSDESNNDREDSRLAHRDHLEEVYELTPR